MSILNRWRQFGKRYFWPHLLLGVIAASIGAPSGLANTEQHAQFSTIATSVNPLSGSVQSISDNTLWQDVSRQSLSHVNPWHQQAIRRFLTRLALAIMPQSDQHITVKENNLNELSIYDWMIVDSLVALLASNKIIIPHQETAFPINHDHLVGQGPALWLVQQGGLRAGPYQYL